MYEIIILNFKVLSICVTSLGCSYEYNEDTNMLGHLQGQIVSIVENGSFKLGSGDSNVTYQCQSRPRQ